MSEQFRFQQVLRQSVTVHRDHRQVRSWAGQVHRPRHHLLAGSCFPRYQHRRPASPHQPDHLDSPLHGRAGADQQVAPALLGDDSGRSGHVLPSSGRVWTLFRIWPTHSYQNVYTQSRGRASAVGESPLFYCCEPSFKARMTSLVRRQAWQTGLQSWKKYRKSPGGLVCSERPGNRSDVQLLGGGGTPGSADFHRQTGRRHSRRLRIHSPST